MDKTPQNATNTNYLEKAGQFDFDNVASLEAGLSSIVFYKPENSDVITIRLINSNRKNYIAKMKNAYNKFQEVGGGQLPILSYGYDEAPEHINLQVLSALKTCKKIFPDVLTMTSALRINLLPKSFKYLDIICPANSHLHLKEQQKFCKPTGTQIWTYVGAGGYYPFPCFERIDQPLINSRAFFWPCITYNLKGWLYFNINRWVPNMDVTRKWPEIWDEWDCSYAGDMNGMHSIFYPGENGVPYPSIRAEVMRDGIEDYNYFKIAEELLKTRKFKSNKQKNDILEFIEKAKRTLSPGMTGFLENIKEMESIRNELVRHIEEMNELPVLQATK
jgi:hypothetical protein